MVWSGDELTVVVPDSNGPGDRGDGEKDLAESGGAHLSFHSARFPAGPGSYPGGGPTLEGTKRRPFRGDAVEGRPRRSDKLPLSRAQALSGQHSIRRISLEKLRLWGAWHF